MGRAGVRSQERVTHSPVRWLRLPGRCDLLAAVGRGGRAPAVVTVKGWQIAVADPIGTVTDVQHLSELARRWGWPRPPEGEAPPFCGGAVGYLSHDLAAGFVGLPEPTGRSPAAMPPLWFGLYDAAACLPPDADETWVVAADLPGLSRTDPDARIDAWQARLDAAVPHGPDRAPGRSVPVRPSLDRSAHADAVARILDWIARGDLYQLNLTLQVAAPWRQGGDRLARRLWAANPGAAHAAWLRLPGGVEIVSVSPETLVRCEGSSVKTRPIKGTRPRAADPNADQAAAEALQASDKDAAEHVMIVDLERNDLGRVCEVGTVHVAALAELEAHPTVWHLTSTVAGRLRTTATLADLLEAVFPSGSVTGAPKRMAVARTAMVESVSRGVYCGAVGVVGAGMVDLSVAIRTAVVADGVASYGTGGGIVADSDPSEEFAEAMDKAAAFFTATNSRPPP